MLKTLRTAIPNVNPAQTKLLSGLPAEAPAGFVSFHDGRVWIKNDDGTWMRPTDMLEPTREEAAARLDELGDREMAGEIDLEDIEYRDEIQAINDLYPGLADEAAGSKPGENGPVR